MKQHTPAEQSAAFETLKEYLSSMSKEELASFMAAVYKAADAA